MSQIQILNFPNNVRVPGVYVGIDPSNASTGQTQQRTLLIGQVTATTTMTLNVPQIATTVASVQAACGGLGSMLARMYAKYRTLDTFGECWLLPIADNGAGVAGTSTLTVTGSATAAGTLTIYVGGQVVQAGVSVADTPTIVGAAITAAAALMPTLPVTVANAAGVVTFSNIHKGAILTDVRINYGGTANGEVIPAGLTVAIAVGATAATNPVLTTALANLIDTPFDFICSPYSDTASITALASLMNDQTGRWSWSMEVFGGVFSAITGTFASIDTFGSTQNNQHMSFMGIGDSPTPQDEIAAAYCATSANSLRSDAALPLTQIPLNILAPPIASRFYISERQTLLFDGISTYIVDQAGNVYVERSITTYQTLPSGAQTTAYLDTETMYTLMGVIRPIRNALQNKFARQKLVIDGTRITAGSNMVTSQTVLGEIISQYSQLANLGLVQDVAGFAKAAYAQNVGNGQVNVYCPFNLSNQLRVTGLAVQFKKS